MKKNLFKVFALIFVLSMLCSCSVKMNKKEAQGENNATKSGIASEEIPDVPDVMQEPENLDSDEDIINTDIPEETQIAEIEETTQEPSTLNDDATEETQNTEITENPEKSVNDRTKEGVVKLKFGEELYFDLDANGIPERILLEKQNGEYGHTLKLSISENGGKVQKLVMGEDFGGFYETDAFVAKVDKKNKNIGYVLISNSYASNDPMTFCIGWKDGKIKYKSDEYGIKNLGFFIDSVEKGFFKARVRSDYFATSAYYQKYVINELNAEAISEDRYYFVNHDRQFEDFALTAKVDLEYVDEDGNEAILPAGTKIWGKAINPEKKRYYFVVFGESYGGYFEFEGTEGELTINGKSEWECFTNLMYAD